MTIFDLVTAQSLTSYWNNTPDTQDYILEELFPVKKQLGNELSYIKGRRGIPIAIRPSTFDAKVMIRERRGFEEVKTKMPFFKEAMYIDEELRQKLLLVIATNNLTYIEAVLNEVFDDEMELIRGARATREELRAQLISTGAINIGYNGVSYTYDYGLEEHQKVTLTDTAKWGDVENSDPINDLNTWADTILQKTGVRPTRAIMRSSTFNYIKNNKKIAASIYITNNGVGIVTPTMVQDVIKTLANIDVYFYDTVYAQVGTDGLTGTNLFPENTVTLLPPTTLGNTVFGTTPEEADLMSSPDVANVKVIDTGVAVTVTKETDPVTVKTKVSQIVMPSFEQADKILIATVN